jgi:hypothetical protein
VSIAFVSNLFCRLAPALAVSALLALPAMALAQDGATPDPDAGPILATPPPGSGLGGEAQMLIGPVEVLITLVLVTVVVLVGLGLAMRRRRR